MSNGGSPPSPRISETLKCSSDPRRPSIARPPNPVLFPNRRISFGVRNVSLQLWVRSVQGERSTAAAGISFPFIFSFASKAAVISASGLRLRSVLAKDPVAKPIDRRCRHHRWRQETMTGPADIAAHRQPQALLSWSRHTQLDQTV